MNYKNLSDRTLLRLYNDLQEERAPIPLNLVKEINSRNLIKSYTEDQEEEYQLASNRIK